MFGPLLPGVEPGSEFVFPDWSPYTELDDAVRAFFRDPEIALSALHVALGDAPVRGFSLERAVSDDGMVWQEAVVCDGRRLLLWHGEDVSAEELEMPNLTGAMTSAVRTVPLSRVTEVGYRQLLIRGEDGNPQLHGVDVYILLEPMDEARGMERDGEQSMMFAHDSIRMCKSAEVAGLAGLQRLLEFAQLIAGFTGQSLVSGNC